MIDRLMTISAVSFVHADAPRGTDAESILEAIFSRIPYVTLERHELCYLCTAAVSDRGVLVSLAGRTCDMIEKQGRRM